MTYTDVCPLCLESVAEVRSPTDHLLLYDAGQGRVTLRVAHQNCLVGQGVDLFRSTQSALKRMKCKRCGLELTLHRLASSSQSDGPAYVRCADGQPFEPSQPFDPSNRARSPVRDLPPAPSLEETGVGVPQLSLD